MCLKKILLHNYCICCSLFKNLNFFNFTLPSAHFLLLMLHLSHFESFGCCHLSSQLDVLQIEALHSDWKFHRDIHLYVFARVLFPTEQQKEKHIQQFIYFLAIFTSSLTAGYVIFSLVQYLQTELKSNISKGNNKTKKTN